MLNFGNGLKAELEEELLISMVDSWGVKRQGKPSAAGKRRRDVGPSPGLRVRDW